MTVGIPSKTVTGFTQKTFLFVRLLSNVVECGLVSITCACYLHHNIFHGLSNGHPLAPNNLTINKKKKIKKITLIGHNEDQVIDQQPPTCVFK